MMRRTKGMAAMTDLILVEPLQSAMRKRKLLLLELFLRGWVSHFFRSVVFLYRKKFYSNYKCVDLRVHDYDLLSS